MKLSGRDASRFLAKPAGAAAILLHGSDPMRVALKRQALTLALVGEAGVAEMRLTRLSAADLRRDPAALLDAVKATGFFPGPRAILVEEAGDGVAPLLATALADWRDGDAVVVVAAGALGKGSALRKVCETARTAVAIAIYDDPPGRDEILATLATAGLAPPPGPAMADLEALSRSLDPGDFAQFIEKLALYKRGDAAPLSPEDIAAIAPPPPEAELDRLIELAAEGNPGGLATALAGLGASGSATGIAIAAGRHFRLLHAAATAADGPEAALARARPPVFGPRRARLAAQAKGFEPRRLEEAIALVTETDLALRSGRPVPAAALVERMLVRLAMLRRR